MNTSIDLKRVAEKISKCLTLATSENTQEAETARRQARHLMNKYNLTQGDVAAHSIHSRSCNIGTRYRPSSYVLSLSAIIAQAFGCEAIGSYSGLTNDSAVEFIGPGIKPELSAYTFDVLRRRLANERKRYLGMIKRFKRSNRIRMANLFCQQWVASISRQVDEFAGSQQEKQAIATFIERHYEVETDERTQPGPQNKNDILAMLAGASAAEGVSIHRPVQQRAHAWLDRSKER